MSAILPYTDLKTAPHPHLLASSAKLLSHPDIYAAQSCHPVYENETAILHV